MALNGPMRIRWRAMDPAEHHDKLGATAWTKVHHSRDGRHDSDARTLCGLIIPDMPYLEDMDEQIPDAAPHCKRCALLAKADGR